MKKAKVKISLNGHNFYDVLKCVETCLKNGISCDFHVKKSYMKEPQSSEDFCKYFKNIKPALPDVYFNECILIVNEDDEMIVRLML